MRACMSVGMSVVARSTVFSVGIGHHTGIVAR